jgi:hypothetical protein
MWGGDTVMVNQLFGDNKNLLFYGPNGHSGIDLKTTGSWKYVRDNQDTDKDGDGWRKVNRDKYELQGRIPIVAAHDGVVSLVLHDDKQGLGWGLFVTKDSEIEKGREVQYRTLYWHIETPWGLLRRFRGIIETIKHLISSFAGRRVRTGAIIAIGGNNGKSTGPHLHFSLDKREKVNGQWTAWKRINPMQYFDQHDALMHATYIHDSDIVDNSKLGTGPYQGAWFYQGKQITAVKAKQIIESTH